MKLLVDRYSPEEKQTIGNFFLLQDNDTVIHRWDSLEPPWLNNQRRISCIPTGFHKARKHNSPRFGSCLWLQDVPNRSEILVHKLNFFKDTLGCIGIGRFLKDLNNDGLMDITDSAKSMEELLSYLKDIDGIMIEIR
jgi:hypothetical protein